MEALSLSAFNAGKSDVNVPNIVKMDANNNYSLLEDEHNVFDCSEVVGLVNTMDGSTLYVYCRGGLYSWDATNNFQLLHEISNLTANMVVDAQNNLYSVMDGIEIIFGDYYCPFAFFNASNEFAG